MKNKLLSILSPEQLIQEFNDLGSATKIAKKFHINPITVYSAFKIINFNCRVNADVANTITPDMLEQTYKELQSFRKVGKKFNISKDSVELYMKKFGIPYNELKIYKCNDEFFTQENETSFYLSGFIAADGCVKNRKNTFELSIGLSKIDKEFLLMIKNILNADSPVRDFLVKNSKRNPKWNDAWKSELVIVSKKYFDDLAKFNIVPRKSLIYTFPEWLIEHPLVHHFMRGYNDGDGSFYKSKLYGNRTVEQIFFSLRGTPQFLEVYRSILENKCGLDVRSKDIRISSGHGCLEYGGNGIVSKIVQYLYKDATIFLPRKKEIIQHLL